MCKPVFKCVTLHFVSVCACVSVCFTHNSIIESMFNKRGHELKDVSGCVMYASV